MELTLVQYRQVAKAVNDLLATSLPGFSVVVDQIATEGWPGWYDRDAVDGYQGPGLRLLREGQPLEIGCSGLLKQTVRRDELARVAGETLGLRLRAFIDPISPNGRSLTFRVEE